jgi:hypothetical protein
MMTARFAALIGVVVLAGCGPSRTVLHDHAGNLTSCGGGGAVVSLNPLVMVVGTLAAGGAAYGAEAMCLSRARDRGFVPLTETPPSAEEVAAHQAAIREREEAAVRGAVTIQTNPFGPHQ